MGVDVFEMFENTLRRRYSDGIDIKDEVRLYSSQIFRLSANICEGRKKVRLYQKTPSRHER